MLHYPHPPPCNPSKINGKKAVSGTSLFATTFKLALSNWETWVVFTSESVTWKVSSLQEVEVRKGVQVLGSVAEFDLMMRWDVGLVGRLEGGARDNAYVFVCLVVASTPLTRLVHEEIHSLCVCAFFVFFVLFYVGGFCS